MSAAVAVTLFASLGLGSMPASAAPADTTGGDTPAVPVPTPDGSARQGLDSFKFAGSLKESVAKRQKVYVQFAGVGAAEVSAAVAAQGKAKQKEAAKARRAALKAQSATVVATAKGKDRAAKQLFTTSNALPGVAIEANEAALVALAARSDVVKITPLVPKTIENSSAAQLTKVLSTWQSTGVTGTGVRVGVIDTGIDYTHADFGGPGTPEAYEEAHAASTGPWTPTAKVVGGYDFSGDDYNADPDAADYQPVPHPDPNPLDCEGHGTHVSGTVAGYGVNADGSTFAGDYGSLTAQTLNAMKIGPGMAPGASLYALKVFGCTGSTNEVIPAMEWALDPNGDGDFSDHLDIINMSLGSDYGVADDPENDVADALARFGVLQVNSAGNAGDLTDVGGSPGNAVRSLGVASSVDPLQLQDGLKVNAPADQAGIVAGQFSVAYDWPNEPPVTGDVVAIPGANADGCASFSAAEAAAVAGKVVWLEWDDNDATRRCGSVGRSGNAVNAGAIGAIFTSSLNVFGAGISGSTVIPVFQLPKVGTDKLRPAMNAGTLNVTFDGSLQATIADRTDSIADTISSFTSRGVHGSRGVVKPDVAAPGDTIASANIGTGDGVLSISGTSMASPHTAGIAALVKAVHPTWTPEQVKAAVMNTAGHDLWTQENQSGLKYGPNRVGAGRVDAQAAVDTTVIAYSTSNPGAVSASFGVVPVATNRVSVTKTQNLRVQNTGARAVEVVLSYDPIISQPGVSYSVSPRVLKVPARGSATAKVTMLVQPTKLRHSIDPTQEVLQGGAPRQYLSDASGRILIQQTGKPTLRVPVYGAAKPVSQTTAKVGKIGGDPAIILKGRGVAQGPLAGGYNSMASVLQYGASSPRQPKCSSTVTSNCIGFGSERSGDLQYVGAGSDSQSMMWFGISTWGEWATIGTTMSPYVDFDVTGDGVPDYQVYATTYPDTDLYVAVLYSYADEATVDILPLNTQWGDVDTNVFDNSVLLLPVLFEDIGVPANAETFPITYWTGTFDGFAGDDQDTIGAVKFDAADPGVGTDGPLFQDPNDSPIAYTLGSKTAKKGAKALVLHLHGEKGKRAEIVSLPAQRR